MAEPDKIELAAEELAQGWPNLVDSLTTPIERLVDRSGSLGQVRDGLAALIEESDVEPMRTALAQAAFAARLSGDADIGRETAAP